MPLTKEERIELLEKARAVKASKKAERDANKIPPKKGRPPKKEINTLNLDDVADETNVEELAEDIKNMEVKEVEEPTNVMELPQQNKEDDDVEVVEEYIKPKKKPKKKIIRRYIEPSSDSEQEIIEEFIKKKPKPKAPKISPRYEPYSRQPEPEPIKLTPPTLNLFCY